MRRDSGVGGHRVGRLLLPAIAVALVALVLPAAASPAEGDLDPDFGSGGVVKTAVSGGFASSLLRQTDGKLILAGTATSPATGNSAVGVARYETDGSPDSAFGSGGKAIAELPNPGGGIGGALQPDGKIVVVGGDRPPGGQEEMLVVRLRSDGTVDSTFGGAGIVTLSRAGFSAEAEAVAVQADGKIVAAGYEYVDGPRGTSNFLIVRLNSDGSLDPSFGSGGRALLDFGAGTEDAAVGVAIQADGRIVATGSTTAAPNAPDDFAVARFNTDGTPDTSFGTRGDGTVRVDASGGDYDYAYGALVQPDGKIVAIGGDGDFVLVRLSSDGTPDAGFGTNGVATADFGGYDNAYSAQIQADGKLVVGGYGGSRTSFALARFNPDGTLDSAFGSGGIVLTPTTSPSGASFGQGVVIQPDGKIVLGGSAFDSTAEFVLARYLGTPPSSGFVTRSGTRLLLDGQPYRPIGLNIYNANSSNNCWYDMAHGSTLDDALTAIGPGKNAMRAWFFQSLATTTGQRDWSAFDHTLAVARAHGVKVIATLANQWADCEPAAGYKDVPWYTDGYKQVDPGGIVSYRDWAQEIVSRYRNDPTILAWQLVNEPEVGHCTDVPESTAVDILSSFASDVSGLIKSSDPNHLVSLGTIGSGQCGASYTDYQRVMSIPTLDLCEFHDYTPSPLIPGDQYNGLQFRIDQCNALAKPLLVGELGIKPSDVGGSLRDRANVVDSKLCAQLTAGVAGELLWAWDKDGSTLNNFDIGPGDPVLDVLSPWSDPSHSCSAPSAPQGVVAAAGDGLAAIGWQAPDSDGSSVIRSYTITSNPGGGSLTVGGSKTTATVGGLTNGVPYTFTVVAANAAGTSVASAPSNAVTPRAGYPTPAAATGTASTTTATTVSTGDDPALTGGTTSSVTVPAGTSGGTVSVTQSGTTVPAPSGYQLGNVQVQITAPAATAANPLTLVFTITPTVGQTVDSTQLYRTEAGTTALVPGCDDPSAHQAVPDPCVSSKSSVTINGASYIQVTVLSSTASIWNEAAPIPAAISVSDSGYSPRTAGLSFGGAANWSFVGKKTHSVTDAVGLGAGGGPLFDSRPLGAGKSYAFRFLAAGSYSYKSTVSGDSKFPTGIIVVPAQATPATGGRTTRFTVVWASARPSGCVFDLRYRFKPAGSTGWKSWVAWKSGVSATSSGFVPNQGAGTYAFDARLRNQNTGRASDYSPDVTISVS